MAQFQVEMCISRYETWLVEAESRSEARAKALADEFVPIVLDRSGDIGDVRVVAIYPAAEAIAGPLVTETHDGIPMMLGRNFLGLDTKGVFDVK